MIKLLLVVATFAALAAAVPYDYFYSADVGYPGYGYAYNAPIAYSASYVPSYGFPAYALKK